jgi:hypothetical protein
MSKKLRFLLIVLAVLSLCFWGYIGTLCFKDSNYIWLYIYLGFIIYNVLFKANYIIISTPNYKKLFYTRPLIYAIRKRKKVYFKAINKYPKNSQFITTYRRKSWI